MNAAHTTALAVLVLGWGSACQSPEPRAPAEQRTDPLWFQAPQSQGLPREHQSALLLFDGRVLITAGYDTAAIGTTEIYEPTTGEIRTVQSLNLPRWYQTAVMLHSGQPMIIAGKVAGAPNSTNTTELFDPVTEKWSAGPSLTGRRERHTTTVLPDGRVLLVGDWGGTDVTNELYDPDGGAWSVLPGQMAVPRSSHSAVLLDDGRVLVVGGFNNSPARDVDLAEIFDPRTLSWSDAGVFGTGRKNIAAVRLLDGRVLLAGGQREVTPPTGIQDEVSIYDPDAGSWTALPPMLATRGTPSLSPLHDQQYLIAGGTGTGANEADVLVPDGGRVLDPLGAGNNRWAQTAVTLANGEIALVGGSNAGGPTGRVLVYFGGNAQWTEVAPVPEVQTQHTATLLPDGTVLVVGRGAWRRVNDSWFDAGQTNRTGHTATLLVDGRVLIVGPDRTVDTYDPGTGSWARASDLPSARQGHTATLLADGRVLVAGGSSDGTVANALATAVVFDPVSGAWTPTSNNLTVPRFGHSATVLRDGHAVVMGGTAGPSQLEVFDIPSNSFQAKTYASEGHRGGTAALLPSGRVMLAGGCCPFTGRVEIMDPSSGYAWSDGGSMVEPFAGAAVAILPSGRALIVGGADAGGLPIDGAWAYDQRRPNFDPLPLPLQSGTRLSATRLLDGRVLVVGGAGTSAQPDGVQLLDEWGGFVARPRLDALAGALIPGTTIQITGKGWVDAPESSTGHHLTSASNYPLLRLERLDTQEVRWARLTNWTDTSATAQLPAELRPGHYVAKVVVAGVTSGPRAFRVALPPGDGGALADAGTAADGGAGGDGGVDADGGAGNDGGTDTDGGFTPPTLRDYRVGCGCGTTEGFSLLGVVALLLRRRRR